MSKLVLFLPVLFVVIVIVWEKFRQKKIRNEYDEMQLEIRGKGAWYGFYTLILYWAFYFIAENAFDFHFLTAGNAVFLGVMISGSVIVGYSILHDSYYGLNWPDSRNLVFLGLIGLIEVVAVVNLVGMLRGGTFADFKTACTDDRMMIVLCIPLFTTILIATLIRRMHPEEEGEQ